MASVEEPLADTEDASEFSNVENVENFDSDSEDEDEDVRFKQCKMQYCCSIIQSQSENDPALRAPEHVHILTDTHNFEWRVFYCWPTTIQRLLRSFVRDAFDWNITVYYVTAEPRWNSTAIALRIFTSNKGLKMDGVFWLESLLKDIATNLLTVANSHIVVEPRSVLAETHTVETFAKDYAAPVGLTENSEILIYPYGRSINRTYSDALAAKMIRMESRFNRRYWEDRPKRMHNGGCLYVGFNKRRTLLFSYMTDLHRMTTTSNLPFMSISKSNPESDCHSIPMILKHQPMDDRVPRILSSLASEASESTADLQTADAPGIRAKCDTTLLLVHGAAMHRETGAHASWFDDTEDHVLDAVSVSQWLSALKNTSCYWITSRKDFFTIPRALLSGECNYIVCPKELFTWETIVADVDQTLEKFCDVFGLDAHKASKKLLMELYAKSCTSTMHMPLAWAYFNRIVVTDSGLELDHCTPAIRDLMAADFVWHFHPTVDTKEIVSMSPDLTGHITFPYLNGPFRLMAENSDMTLRSSMELRRIEPNVIDVEATSWEHCLSDMFMHKPFLEKYSVLNAYKGQSYDSTTQFVSSASAVRHECPPNVRNAACLHCGVSTWDKGQWNCKGQFLVCNNCWHLESIHGDGTFVDLHGDKKRPRGDDECTRYTQMYKMMAESSTKSRQRFLIIVDSAPTAELVFAELQSAAKNKKLPPTRIFECTVSECDKMTSWKTNGARYVHQNGPVTSLLDAYFCPTIAPKRMACVITASTLDRVSNWFRGSVVTQVFVPFPMQTHITRRVIQCVRAMTAARVEALRINVCKSSSELESVLTDVTMHTIRECMGLPSCV